MTTACGDPIPRMRTKNQRNASAVPTTAKVTIATQACTVGTVSGHVERRRQIDKGGQAQTGGGHGQRRHVLKAIAPQ